MTKHIKLRLSLPSFHLCCSERTSSPKSPLPAATYMFSPVSPKAFEIPYPNFPDPPPSTPVHPTSKCHVTSKTTPVHCQYPAKPFQCNTISRCNTKKMHNSPLPNDSSHCSWQIPPPKRKNKEEKNRRNNSKGATCVTISSANSDWFSSEGDEQSEETESLFQSSGLDSSNDFGYPLETVNESSMNTSISKKKNLKVHRLKHYLLNSCKGGEETKTAKCTPDYESPVKKSVSRRVLPGMVEGKVNESYAVVKRSDDPYEDFKCSMLEMILEKQLFEDKDLEQLLQCFLSLNSRHHHLVIVLAFSEIWEELFNI